jgi:hypothetical protein
MIHCEWPEGSKVATVLGLESDESHRKRLQSLQFLPQSLPQSLLQSLLQALCSTNTFNTCDIGHFIHLEVELVSIKVGLEFG